MRKLRWLVGVLVVANIVLFLMPQKESRMTHVYQEQENLNSDLLSLLNEQGQPIPDASNSEELVEVEEESAETKEPSATEKTNDQSFKNLICYRVGPFLKKSNIELARAVLDNANVEYTQSKRESRRANVYRVYLGPWENRNEAQSVKQELLSKGVADHFEKKQKDGSWIISLGIYLNENSAKSEVQRFRKQNMQASIRGEEQILPTNYWLNLNFEQKSNHLIKSLAVMDWGGYAAKLVVYPCS